MNNREKRKYIAEDTLKILEQGYFQTPNGQTVSIEAAQASAVENTLIYTPEMSDDLLSNRISQPLTTSTIIEVNGETTLNATRQLLAAGYEDVLCLNFASAKNPGGGFLGGSQAQEESIARSTGLYNCQMKAWDYYEVNRHTKTCIYTDNMIYSPYVPILKDEAGTNLDHLALASIITAPAVNFGVVKQREQNSIPKVEAIMKRRIAKVLAIALAHGHKAIVLGAWGCGVFQNDPKDIAPWFKEVIDSQFKNEFEKIVFAVYARNERFITPFLEVFA